ncbi:hypothetical protein [Butyrivibrio sp. MB2005]|uniref:hypothetical protein n=1 Tax=Butyrivibrio sp. MB2005 TaxID=1280678 RepID=UPI00042551A6|nr:hypothetical protein [Butyrivibrio sp. MB2005]
MRKSIARKLAGLLAAVVLTSTFASDYNSIGARASEVTEITEETLEAEGTNEEAVEETVPSELEAETPAEEEKEEETVVEEAAEAVEETPADETPADETPATEEAVDTADEGSTEEASDAAGEGSTEETGDAQEETPAEETPADETPAEETPTEENPDAELPTEEIASNAADTSSTEEAPAEEVREKEFKASKEIDGILVSLYADPEVLPDDAVLDIKKVEDSVEEQIKDKIDDDMGEDVEVAQTFSYDINIYSESYDGYVQPEDGTVEVRFSKIEEAADKDVDLAVYHVEDDLSNVEPIKEITDSTAQEIKIDAEHFSIYSVVLYGTWGTSYSFDIQTVTKENGENKSIGNDGIRKVNIDWVLFGDSVSAEEVAPKISDYAFDYAVVEVKGKETKFECFRRPTLSNELIVGDWKIAFLYFKDIASVGKDTVIRFYYKKTNFDKYETYDHIDVGFTGTKFDELVEKSASVSVSITPEGSENTATYCMEPLKDADHDLGVHEYRLQLGRWGTPYKVTTKDKIVFNVVYGDKSYTNAKIASEALNREAYERCYNSHQYRQGVFGFDYTFQFTEDQFDIPEDEEAEYTINCFMGIAGKYPSTPVLTLSSENTDKVKVLGDKTVKEKFGTAIVGKKFEPVIEESINDGGVEYELDKTASGSKLVLDPADADKTKNVLNVYYAAKDNLASVAFYVLLPNKTIPEDSTEQDVRNYFPSKNSTDYTYEKWKGTAVDLYALDTLPNYESDIKSKIDKHHNLWDRSMSGIINTLIKSIDSTTINEDLESYLSNVRVKKDASGKTTRPAELSDIKWYVYKNTAGNTYNNDNPAKAYHIDGYIENAQISVTYHANFDGCTEEPVEVTGLWSGNSYDVQEYADTFTTAPEGKKFVGWTTAADGTGDKYKDPDVDNDDALLLVHEMDFYAQWEDIEYTTKYFDEADDEGKHALLGDNVSAKVQQKYGDKTYTIDDPEPKKDADGNVIKEFVGWKAADGKTYSRNWIKDTPVEGDQEFYAVYEIVGGYKKYYINYYYQKADGTYEYRHEQPADTSYNDKGEFTSDYFDSLICGPVYVSKTGVKVSVKPEQRPLTKTKNNVEYTLVDKGEANWWEDTIKTTTTKQVVLNVYYKRADFDTELDVYADTDSAVYNGIKQNSVTGSYDINSTLAKDYNITVEASVNNEGITNVRQNPATGVKNKKVTKVTLVNKVTGEKFVIDASTTEDGKYIVNDTFTKIRVHDGAFTITPKPVTLTSDDLKREFNAQPLTNAERKVLTGKDGELLVEDGWVGEEGAIYTFTGSQTVKGTSANAFTYVAKENTDFENYSITKTEGTLEITQRSERFEIIIKLTTENQEQGADTYVYYSGVDQKANMNVDVTVNTDVIKNAAKNAGLLGNLTQGIGSAVDTLLNSLKIKASAEDDPTKIALDPVVKEVTDKMTITVDGLYLTGGHGTVVGDYPILLHTKGLAVTLQMDGKNYDVSDEFQIKVVREGDKTDVQLPKSLNADDETNAPAEDANNNETTGESETENAKVEEDPTEVIGYLHVLKREVVLTSGSASKVYDGTPLTEKTVTASEVGEKTGFVHGEGANFDVTGTITNPGSVANTFSYTLYDGTVEGQPKTDIGNYDITTVEGTLTVTDDTEVPDKDDKKKKTDDDPDDDDDEKKVPNGSVEDDSDDDDSPSQPSVLGVKREPETPAAEEAQVLGARRGGTEDNTNTARVLVLVFAAGAAVSLMAIGRRKKEENE